jgi:hypothetical protein
MILTPHEDYRYYDNCRTSYCGRGALCRNTARCLLIAVSALIDNRKPWAKVRGFFVARLDKVMMQSIQIRGK